MSRLRKKIHWSSSPELGSLGPLLHEMEPELFQLYLNGEPLSGTVSSIANRRYSSGMEGLPKTAMPHTLALIHPITTQGRGNEINEMKRSEEMTMGRNEKTT